MAKNFVKQVGEHLLIQTEKPTLLKFCVCEGG